MRAENLPATLEKSLRQTRATQNRLQTERDELRGLSNEISPGQERLLREIELLERIAKQTEYAIFCLLAARKK